MAKPFWRRPVVIVPAAVVIIGSAAFFGLRAGKSNAGASQRGTSQQLYTVEPTTLQETVSASGTIAPSDSEDLSFSSPGTVTTVDVKAGQQVQKGQVLASISSAALQSELQQAESSLASAQAQLTDDQNSGADSAQIAADQANVAAAQANAVSAYEALLGANLTSPIAGTVSTVNLAVGEVLGSSGGSGTSLTGTGTGSGRSPSNGAGGNSAANASNAASSASSPQIEVVSNSFVVNLSVDTKTVSSIKVGQAATVTPTSSSGTSRAGGGGAFALFAGGGGGLGGAGGGFGGAGGGAGANNTSSQGNASTAVGAAATGTVTSVGTVASSSSGVATFPVVVTIDGTPASFHAGASATAAIVSNELPNVLAVPITAVTRSNGQSYVTLSVNGRQSKEPVTIGTTVNAQVQITGGLQAGDQVVVTVPTIRRTGATGGGTNGTGRTGGFGGFGGGGRTGVFGGNGGAGTP